MATTTTTMRLALVFLVLHLLLLLATRTIDAHAALVYTRYGPDYVDAEAVYRVYPALRNVTRPMRPTLNFATCIPATGASSWYFVLHTNSMKAWTDLTNARGGLNISGVQYDVTFTWSTDDSSLVLAQLIYEDYLRNITSPNNQYILVGPLNNNANPSVRPLIEARGQVVYNFWGSNHDVYRPGYNYSFGGWNLGDETFKPQLRLWWRRVQPLLPPSSTITVCLLSHPGAYSQFSCEGGRQVLAEINATTAHRVQYVSDGMFPYGATTAEAATAFAPCTNVDLLLLCNDYVEPAMLPGMRRSQIRPKAALTIVPVATFDLSDPANLEAARPWMSYAYMDAESPWQANLPFSLFPNFPIALDAMNRYTRAPNDVISVGVGAAWDVLFSTLITARSFARDDLRAAWLALDGFSIFSRVSVDPITGANVGMQTLPTIVDMTRPSQQRVLRDPMEYPYPASWPWPPPLAVGDVASASIESSGALVGVVLSVLGAWVAQILLEQAMHSLRDGGPSYLFWLLAVSIALGLIGVWSSIVAQVAFLGITAQSTTPPISYSLSVVLLGLLSALLFSFAGLVVLIQQVRSQPGGLRRVRGWRARHGLRADSSANLSATDGSRGSISTSTGESIVAGADAAGAASASAPAARALVAGATKIAAVAPTPDIAGYSAEDAARVWQDELRQAQQHALDSVAAHFAYVARFFGIHSLIGGGLIATSILLTRVTIASAIVTNAKWTTTSSGLYIAAEIVNFALCIASMHWSVRAIRFRKAGGFVFMAAVLVELNVWFASLTFTWTGSDVWSFDRTTVLYSGTLLSAIAMKLLAGLFAAVTCLGSIALQFSRMQLSRNDLAQLSLRLKRSLTAAHRQSKAKDVIVSSLCSRIERLSVMFDLMDTLHALEVAPALVGLCFARARRRLQGGAADALLGAGATGLKERFSDVFDADAQEAGVEDGFVGDGPRKESVSASNAAAAKAGKPTGATMAVGTRSSKVYPAEVIAAAQAAAAAPSLPPVPPPRSRVSRQSSSHIESRSASFGGGAGTSYELVGTAVDATTDPLVVGSAATATTLLRPRMSSLSSAANLALGFAPSSAAVRSAANDGGEDGDVGSGGGGGIGGAPIGAVASTGDASDSDSPNVHPPPSRPSMHLVRAPSRTQSSATLVVTGAATSAQIAPTSTQAAARLSASVATSAAATMNTNTALLSSTDDAHNTNVNASSSSPSVRLEDILATRSPRDCITRFCARRTRRRVSIST